MISVKVKAILDIATIMGSYQVVVSLKQGSKVSDLLDLLEHKHGDPFRDRLYSNVKTELRPEMQLLLNGKMIVFLDGLNTEVNDGDELFIMSPIGGG